MWKAKLITIALICGLSVMTGPRVSVSQTVAQSPATKKPQATTQTPSDQEEASAQDEETPPVKKKFTPAQSLNEALYLSTREDRNTTAYLDQAKNLLDQGADPKAVDPQKRTPLHWAVIGAMYADKKQASSYLDIAELLIAQGAEVNAEDRYGNTPLDYQELSSAQQMLELLLEADGTGRNDLVRLEELLSSISVAAKAGDLVKVQAELQSDLALGVVIPIKLTTPVSSNKSRAGDPLEAVVAAPILVDNHVVIAPGTRLEGTVLYAGKSPNRFERSQLVLGFSNLVYSDEKMVQLALRLTAVDNARETVEMGRIIGVSYPNSALSQKKVTWGRRLIGMAAPALGYAIEASTMVYNRKFNREILYAPGTDVALKLMIPAKLNAPQDLKGWPTFSPSEELVKLVAAQPHRVGTKEGKPVDLTNVMLIGPQTEVDGAFRSAGWADAAGLNASSGLKTFAAVMFKQGYDRAPFSDLYLGGRAADLTFQKQLNTFAKRHHIRIWKVGSYQGKDLWVGAATHDIGMGVDRKGVKPHWYHTVDTRVDSERDKIMNDILFTGKAKAYSLVERPEMPKKNLTPAGNSRDTDGRMLVLALN
jgi:LssY C-terminus/Ankyrin repeats (many copies)